MAKTRICFALAGPALLMIVALAGCARGGHVAREWDVPEQPVRGGECVLALQADGRTLDPHRATDAASMRLIENMYSTLMRYTDKYGEIQPYLAEHVELSDDRLTYTFTLRSDARFHFSHRVMTSEDARYSIERIREQRVRAEQFKHIASIDTPDKHTLVITLTQPVAPFLTYLAYPMNAIVDREVVEKHEGRLDNVAGGTGPFRLVEWRKDRHLIMERHPAYHIEDLPYLDRVRWRPIPDETARVTALRNLEIDGMLDVPDKDRALLERTDYLSLQSVPGTFWEYVGLNTQRPPFDDARVRQAVAWAVDRDMINRIVKRGRATVADGDFFPPDHWAWSGSSVYPERDVARARDLMEEAGYAEGARAQLKVGSAFPYQVAAAQIVKQNLKEIGLAVDLLTAESSVFFDALGKGEFDMTLVGWLGFVDPDEWFYNIFHSEGAWNQQQYSNPDLDALLEQGRMESNQDRRREQYQRAQKMILKDAPVVLLYINEQTSAFLNRVQGYRVHPTATTLSLRETWLAPEQEE